MVSESLTCARGKWIVILLLVTLLSFLSGCITQPGPAETSPVTITASSPEMRENLTRVINAEKELYRSLMNNVENLQDLIQSGDADNQTLHAWLQDFYARFPLIHSTWYYNAQTNERTGILQETRNYTSFPFPEYQESDFTNTTSILVGPTYIEGETYLVTLAIPIYTADGTYHGYWMQACDPYLVVKYLYIQSGADTSYIFYLVRSDGTILYSSRSYVIGNSIDATFPGTSLGKILFANASGGVHYTTEYSDYFGYSNQIIPVTGTWVQATVMGEPAAYLVTRPDDSAAIRQDKLRVADKDEMAEIIRTAVSYANTHTQEESLNYIMNLKENCRVMAFTLNGDLLADSLMQNKYVGINFRSTRDIYGVRTIRDMIYRAQHGGGFCREYYPVVDAEVPEEALFGHAYVLPVGDGTSWFIAALSPVSTEILPVHMDYRDAVLYPVFDVVAFVHDHGKNATLQEIQKPGAFSDQNTERKEFWIFAMDYDGNLLASSRYPDAVGKSVLGYTDIYGNSIGRELVMLAKNGGGATYLCEHDDAGENVLIYMLNVESVGTEWFFVTAVHMNEMLL